MLENERERNKKNKNKKQTRLDVLPSFFLSSSSKPKVPYSTSSSSRHLGREETILRSDPWIVI